ncbi:MAG: class C beta-lactamase-related serine hydrolase [Flavobacteriaceae bacterium]|nr:class C beta-lactamase-related serine hydrolase [Flavobacteriaceae bacterium]
MKLFKRILVVLLALVFLVNLYILLSGHSYIYKAVWYNLADIDDAQFFESRTIKAGKPVALPRSVAYNQGEMSQQVLDYHKQMESVAYIAIRNDSLLHEEYWDGYSESSLSSSFSISKSVVAAMIGVALKEGKLKSLDEPVGNYLPHFAEGKNKALTIRHLLTMSAANNFDESYVNPFSFTTEAYYGNNLPTLMEKLNVVSEPGKMFDYQSGNQIILAAVLEKATGQNLSTYLSEKIWTPMGAMHDATWSLDKKDSHEKAYCCINSNAIDFARFGQIYLHHGKLYGNDILDSSFVAESITPANINDEHGKPCDFYGLGWWLTNIDHKGKTHQVYYMRGILGQYCLVIPDKNLVIVRLGHKRSNDKIGEHCPDIYEYMHGILDAYE